MKDREGECFANSCLSRCEKTIYVQPPPNPEVVGVSPRQTQRARWSQMIIMALTMTVEILDPESSNYPAKGFLALQQERDVIPSKRESLQKARAKKFNYIFVSICFSVKWRY